MGNSQFKYLSIKDTSLIFNEKQIQNLYRIFETECLKDQQQQQQLSSLKMTSQRFASLISSKFDGIPTQLAYLIYRGFAPDFNTSIDFEQFHTTIAVLFCNDDLLKKRLVFNIYRGMHSFSLSNSSEFTIIPENILNRNRVEDILQYIPSEILYKNYPQYNLLLNLLFSNSSSLSSLNSFSSSISSYPTSTSIPSPTNSSQLSLDLSIKDFENYKGDFSFLYDWIKIIFISFVDQLSSNKIKKLIEKINLFYMKNIKYTEDIKENLKITQKNYDYLALKYKKIFLLYSNFYSLYPYKKLLLNQYYNLNSLLSIYFLYNYEDDIEINNKYNNILLKQKENNILTEDDNNFLIAYKILSLNEIKDDFYNNPKVLDQEFFYNTCEDDINKKKMDNTSSIYNEYDLSLNALNFTEFNSSFSTFSSYYSLNAYKIIQDKQWIHELTLFSWLSWIKSTNYLSIQLASLLFFSQLNNIKRKTLSFSNYLEITSSLRRKNLPKLIKHFILSYSYKETLINSIINLLLNNEFELNIEANDNETLTNTKSKNSTLPLILPSLTNLLDLKISKNLNFSQDLVEAMTLIIFYFSVGRSQIDYERKKERNKIQILLQNFVNSFQENNVNDQSSLDEESFISIKDKTTNYYLLQTLSHIKYLSIFFITKSEYNLIPQELRSELEKIQDSEDQCMENYISLFTEFYHLLPGLQDCFLLGSCQFGLEPINLKQEKEFLYEAKDRFYEKEDGSISKFSWKERGAEFKIISKSWIDQWHHSSNLGEMIKLPPIDNIRLFANNNYSSFDLTRIPHNYNPPYCFSDSEASKSFFLCCLNNNKQLQEHHRILTVNLEEIEPVPLPVYSALESWHSPLNSNFSSSPSISRYVQDNSFIHPDNIYFSQKLLMRKSPLLNHSSSLDSSIESNLSLELFPLKLYLYFSNFYGEIVSTSELRGEKTKYSNQTYEFIRIFSTCSIQEVFLIYNTLLDKNLNNQKFRLYLLKKNDQENNNGNYILLFENQNENYIAKNQLWECNIQHEDSLVIEIESEGNWPFSAALEKLKESQILNHPNYNNNLDAFDNEKDNDNDQKENNSQEIKIKENFEENLNETSNFSQIQPLASSSSVSSLKIKEKFTHTNDITSYSLPVNSTSPFSPKNHSIPSSQSPPSTLSNTTPSLTSSSIPSAHTPLTSSSLSSSQISTDLSKPLGLDNLGNTCYINSTLQTLYHTPLFRSFFEEKDEQINLLLRLQHLDKIMKKYSSTSGEFTKSYLSLGRKLWFTEDRKMQNNGESTHSLIISPPTSINPKPLVRLIMKLFSDFDNDNQHDAHELLLMIFNTFSSELHFNLDDLNELMKEDDNLEESNSEKDGDGDENNDKESNDRGEDNENKDQSEEKKSENQLILAEKMWESQIKNERSVIQSLFMGMLLSLLECPSCSYSSSCFEPFLILSLPLPIASIPDSNDSNSENDSEEVLLIVTISKLSESSSESILSHSDYISQQISQERQYFKLKLLVTRGTLIGEIIEKVNKFRDTILMDCVSNDNSSTSSSIPTASSESQYQYMACEVLSPYKLTAILKPEMKVSTLKSYDSIFLFDISTLNYATQLNLSKVVFLPRHVSLNPRQNYQKNPLTPISLITSSPPFFELIPNNISGNKLYELIYSRLKRYYRIPLSLIKDVDLNTDLISSSSSSSLQNGLNNSSIGNSSIPFCEKIDRVTSGTNEEVFDGPIPTYGFTLRFVKPTINNNSSTIYSGSSTSSDLGSTCSICPWINRCPGCVIPSSSSTTISINDLSSLSVDFHNSISLGGLDFPSIGLMKEFDFTTWEGDNQMISSVSQQPSPTRTFQSRIGKNQKVITLEECFEKFNESENLDGVICSQCEKKRKDQEQIDNNKPSLISTPQFLSRRYWLWKLPPICILHLKRFRFDSSIRKKLYNVVDFPFYDLDLSPFLAPNKKSEEKRNNLYNLYGVIHHIGALSGGHYVSTIRQRISINNENEAIRDEKYTEKECELPSRTTSFDSISPSTPQSTNTSLNSSLSFYQDKWFLLNDNVVSEVKDKENIIGSTPYLLFYVRKELDLGQNKVESKLLQEVLIDQLKKLNIPFDEKILVDLFINKELKEKEEKEMNHMSSSLSTTSSSLLTSSSTFSSSLSSDEKDNNRKNDEGNCIIF